MKKSDINILVVEDDATFRSVLTEGFKRSGYKTIAVSSPSEALNVVKIKVIHLTIVDCMLPKMNGVDLSVELKKNGLGDAPLILMSGIFKDKVFINKSLQKTGAKHFLAKPFDMNELLSNVDEILKGVVDAPKLPLHVLLSKAKLSTRDKIKALDRVESLTGLDLPFIFSLLYMSEADGSLNIFGKNFSIYGVTFHKGEISKVDSDQSEEILKKILLDDNCLQKSTLEEFETKKIKGDILTNLIDENYLSPHILAIAKRKQIVVELQDLVRDTDIEINFSPGTTSKDDFSLSRQDYFKFQNDMIWEKFDDEWFNSFYNSLKDHPIEMDEKIEETHPLRYLSIFSSFGDVFEALSEESTLDDLLKKFKREDVYKMIHLLSINRFILFSESKRRSSGPSTGITKIEHLIENFAEKDPFEIFQYFGASKNCPPAEVGKLYKDFAKTYHPDKFTGKISDENKSKIHDLFSKVTDAHNVLTDEKSREEFNKHKLQKSAEKQFKADSLLERGVQALHQLKYQEARQLIVEAYGMHKNDKTELYYFWAHFKDTKIGPKAIIKDVKKFFETHEDYENQKNIEYLMVKGLYCKYIKNMEDAVKYFKAVLEKDPRALYARRELSSLATGSSSKNNKKESLLTGDITSVISNIFKKKSG